MRSTKTSKIVTLHTTCKTFTNACTTNINKLAFYTSFCMAIIDRKTLRKLEPHRQKHAIKMTRKTGTQAHVDDQIAFWRAHSGCSSEQTTQDDGTLSCTTWPDCADGTRVRLCTHTGGHGLVEGWVERELAWLLEGSRQASIR